MYPPPGSPPTQPAAPAAPASTPSVGSGGGVSPGVGQQAPAGNHPPSLPERLQQALANESAISQTGQTPPNPAADMTGPAFVAQQAAAAAAQGLPVNAPPPPNPPQPAIQPLAQQPVTQPVADTPEIAALRQQAAAAQQAQAQIAQMQGVMQQMQQWAAYGAQAYQRERTQPAAQPVAQPTPAQVQESITGVPQFDHTLLQFMDRDAQGNTVLKPGAPPDLLMRYRDYEQKATQFYRDFAQNPLAVLQKPLEKLVNDRLESAVQQRLQERDGQQYAQSWVRQNTGILFQTHPNGQVATDFMGNPQLSEVGQMFYRTVQTLEQNGIRDPRQQQQIAERMVAGELALRQAQAARQPQQPQQPQIQSPPAQPQYQQQPQQLQQAPQYAQQPFAQQAQLPQAQPFAPPQQVNPLALLAQQAAASRAGFLQAAVPQYTQQPGGPATPPSYPAPGPIPPAPTRFLSLQERLQNDAPQYGIDLRQVA